MVLVVGGFGYIGTHVCIELLNAGYDVKVVDSGPISDLIKINTNLFKITGRKATLVSKKATSKADFRDIFANSKIDIVIHLACGKSPANFDKDPLNNYSKDLFATINLLSVMNEFNVKKILFSSSTLVYSENGNRSLKESSATSITNTYVRCKLFIEGLLSDLYNSDNSWDILILRYFNTAGVHKSYLISDGMQNGPSNLFSSIISSLEDKKRKLVVFGDDFPTSDGSNERDYVHVMDIAKGTQLGVDLLVNDHLEDIIIINLCSGNKNSVFSIIKMFESATKRKITFQVNNRRCGDVAISYGDNSLAKKMLGWSPKHDLKDICLDLCNYHNIKA